MHKIEIPEHIQQLRSYKPGKPIEQVVEELGLKETAILWNNENNLGPSPKAMEAIRSELQHSHLYPDPTASRLRAEIATREGISADQVVVGNGSEAILGNIFQGFFGPEDVLLTSEGTFVAVYIWAQSHNRPVVKIPLREDYSFDLDKMAAAIDEHTKVIYIANPNNPTGTMITKQEFEAFMQKVPEDVLVISDEAYYEYAVDLSDDFADSIKLRYPNVITLRTFSKAFGIASIRIGYAMGPLEIIETLAKIKMTFEPSNVAQAAGLGALSDSEYLEESLINNRKGIKLFKQLFEELGVKYAESYANFLMIDLGSEERVNELSQKLMKKGVFVRPLKAFGLPHCMRVSVGLQAENELFVKSFREVF